MSYDDQNLLSDPDKGVREARGILSAMWRQFLVVLKIDPWGWDKRMRKYLADPRNGIPNNSRDRSSARGNLNKELNRPDMTWRVFLKAIVFLGPTRAVFSVKLTFPDGRTYTVSAKLKDRGPMPPEGSTEAQNVYLGGSDDVADPLDHISELHTSEHRARLTNPIPKSTFSAEDLINALRSKDRP